MSASTQNQALSALLFLYRDVLAESDGQRGTVPWLDNVTRAKKPERLPVVLSPSEVQRLLRRLEGEAWLQAALMYGSGLRVSEAVGIRIKDLDLDQRSLVVRGGKGQDDLHARGGARGLGDDQSDGSAARVTCGGLPRQVARRSRTLPIHLVVIAA